MSGTPFIMPPLPGDDRLLELIAEHVTCGLSDAGEQELRGLLPQEEHELMREMESAAAIATLAALPATDMLVPLPAALRSKIEYDAATLWRRTVEPRPSEASTTMRSSVAGRINRMGWIAAAAGLALAAIAWWPRATSGRASLDELARAPGTSTIQWATWPAKTPAEDPGTQEIVWAREVTGKVVWNSGRQEGFMVFTGMKPNDPMKFQYQLWIIDGVRRHPVDGGVFDVTGDESVVRIDPKLRIGEPVAFAVTIEKPGGVVVSDQQARVVVAAAAK